MRLGTGRGGALLAADERDQRGDAVLGGGAEQRLPPVAETLDQARDAVGAQHELPDLGRVERPGERGVGGPGVGVGHPEPAGPVAHLRDVPDGEAADAADVLGTGRVGEPRDPLVGPGAHRAVGRAPGDRAVAEDEPLDPLVRDPGERDGRAGGDGVRQVAGAAMPVGDGLDRPPQHRAQTEPPVLHQRGESGAEPPDVPGHVVDAAVVGVAGDPVEHRPPGAGGEIVVLVRRRAPGLGHRRDRDPHAHLLPGSEKGG